MDDLFWTRINVDWNFPRSVRYPTENPIIYLLDSRLAYPELRCHFIENFFDAFAEVVEL